MPEKWTIPDREEVENFLNKPEEERTISVQKWNRAMEHYGTPEGKLDEERFWDVMICRNGSIEACEKRPFSSHSDDHGWLLVEEAGTPEQIAEWVRFFQVAKELE